MKRDENGNLTLLPAAQGRIAFWHGRPIYSNPFENLQGREFAAGWRKAEAAFTALGGVTDEDRVRLRPDDLPEPRRVKRLTSKGVAKRRRVVRQAKGENKDFDWNVTLL